MRDRLMYVTIALLVAMAAAHAPGAAAGTAAGAGGTTTGNATHWVGTWYGAPAESSQTSRDQSYRMLVHNALGGTTVRLRFSNRYGTAPLTLRDVNLALPLAGEDSPALRADTITPVTFRGAQSVVVAAGAEVRSDSTAFALPQDSDVAISFDVPGDVEKVTRHELALTTSWRTQKGEGGHALDPLGTAFKSIDSGWSFVTGLEVRAPLTTTTVVALGDSITDGAVQVPNSDGRWPDLVNDRIAASPEWRGLRSVVNAGISGNMVTADRGGNATQGQAAVTRAAWDVFDQPNVSHLVLYEGINDVGEGVAGDEIVEGLRTIVRQAQRRGITVIGSPLTPSFGHMAFGPGYTTNEAARGPVNQWVSSGGEVDHVVDFNAAVRADASPETWRPELTPDLLHPNPLGLSVMADAFPLHSLR